MPGIEREIFPRASRYRTCPLDYLNPAWCPDRLVLNKLLWIPASKTTAILFSAIKSRPTILLERAETFAPSLMCVGRKRVKGSFWQRSNDGRLCSGSKSCSKYCVCSFDVYHRQTLLQLFSLILIQLLPKRQHVFLTRQILLFHIFFKN